MNIPILTPYLFEVKAKRKLDSIPAMIVNQVEQNLWIQKPQPTHFSPARQGMTITPSDLPNLEKGLSPTMKWEKESW